MKDKIEKVLSDINEITEIYKNQKVTLVAVSKKKQVSEILKATKFGIKNFGENYLQESLPKITALKDEEIIWHFIGKIQSNKCKDIAENFEWIHTLDRLKIAEKLNKYVPKGKKLNVLIQINLDHDENKGGICKEKLDDFYSELRKLENLNFRGLMIMPSAKAKKNELLLLYKEAFTLADKLYASGGNKIELSMGMSQDFKIALKEGSTIVRIGTGIFGER